MVSLAVDPSGIALREAWLNVLVDRLRPVFKDRGYPLPEKIRVSCGFPHHKSFGKQQVVGQCWYPGNSADDTTEIFVSPVQANAMDVAETVTHEGCHSHLGPGFGHRAKFAKVAGALGFKAPWKSTPATPELTKLLETLLPGEYPHAELMNKSPEGGLKPEKTYLLKATCSTCGYTIRVTKKWAEAGLPTCTVCSEQFELAEEG